MAFHAAALAALENDLGWDPRTADVVVGTSAGSMVGAMLRSGVSATDLAALTVSVPAPEVPEVVAAALAERSLPPLSLAALLRMRPPPLPVVTSWMRRPWRIDPVLAATAVLADGRVDADEHIGRHIRTLADGWPDRDLWICAVRQRDLRRVVFGRDVDAGLADAVAASCSIPGYFRPTRVDGELFIDGGVRSPTNADVLRRSEVDVAVVVSPMSGRDLPRFHPGAAVRRHAKARVDHEVRVLRDHGTPSVVIEPGPATAGLIGDHPLRDDHLREVVTATFLETGEQLLSSAARLLGRRRPDLAGAAS